MAGETGQWQGVLDRIDREELVELALALGNIPSPTGQEKEVGRFLLEWMQRQGFEARAQEVLPERSNIVGRLRGEGGGCSLLFNAHMDTSRWAPIDRLAGHEDLPIYNRAWEEDGKVFGMGVVNDKGPLAAFLIAAKAIKQSGHPLKGDLILTAVVGEIGQAPVDEFQGPRYLGKGIGSRYLVDHGTIADYVLVAEATDFGMTWTEAGVAYLKISVHGSSYYTPHLPRPDPPAGSPNAIVKAARVIEAFEGWAADYERRYRRELPCGTLVPKASIGAIRGGIPYRPASTSRLCNLYVDVRLPPGLEVGVVIDDLRHLLAGLGVEADIEPFLTRRGYVGQQVERLAGAIERAHRRIFQAPLPPVEPAVTSMWRDVNIFNEVGIPAITYGPAASAGGGGQFIAAEDLHRAAQLYALIALDLCNQPKG